MTAETKKNNVVFGYVLYFIGLSLLGVAIYQWSKPLPVVEIINAEQDSSASIGVIEGEEEFFTEDQAESEGSESSEEDVWN